MKHSHTIEVKDNEQEIKQFAQEFVDLWLEKHRDLERFDLLQVLIELILNPDAKYYKLESKERDSWLMCAITYLTAEGLNDKSQVLILPSAQIEALYRFVVGFDDGDLCDDCKAELRDKITADVALKFAEDLQKQERKEKKRRWWQRNKKNKKPKDYGNQQYGAIDCPSMTE